MERDEILYGDYTVHSETHGKLRERLAGANASPAGLVTLHEGENEFGNRVVFWTKPMRGSTSFIDAVENDLLHKEDGPAAVHFLPEGGVVRSWWVNGIRHREDGPAIEGRPTEPDEYWIDGFPLTKEAWREETGN